jgi:hypothetical protein
MDYLMVSKQELEGIIHNTGWAVQRCFDIGTAGYFLILEKA